MISSAASKPKTETVRVLRAFSVGGVRQEPGTDLVVDCTLAVELVSAAKAERVVASTAPSAPAPARKTPAKAAPIGDPA